MRRTIVICRLRDERRLGRRVLKRRRSVTFYFLALLNKRDEAHVKAVPYAGQIDKLTTTEWVMTELADGLASSRQRKMFVQTRNEVLADSDAMIVPFELHLYEEGIKLFDNRKDKEWSLTDCISFVVMQKS